MHAHGGDPSRGGKLVKEKAVRIVGVKTLTGREERV